MTKQRTGGVTARATVAIFAFSEEGAQQPAGRAHNEQRRNGEAEQQVLHHVRAEQIRVAQVVQWPVQRAENHQQAAEERDLLRPPDLGDVLTASRRACLHATRAPHVQPA